MIKRWTGYSSISATDVELLQFLGIVDEDTTDVSMIPGWAKNTLGKWTVNNQILANELRNTLSYLYNNMD